VIRGRVVASLLGYFLVGIAGIMCVPLAWGLATGDSGRLPLAGAIACSALAGAGLLLFRPRPAVAPSRREALLVVVLAWLVLSVFGGLPFYFSPYFPTFTDAYFEASSGLTTTGASVLSDVEVLPQSLNFWRCFSHWIGGLGIVVLGVAILPLVGHGGLDLYRAEFSGARSERLTPRIAETAWALWRIYIALSVAQFIALRLAGLSVFDSLCHTFATLGTGGFSTRSASVAAFENPAAEYIIILFMALAGMSFVQHYRLWMERQPRRFFQDVEIRAYLLILLATSAVIALELVFRLSYGVEHALRASAFQVVSIMTTTGFASDDFERWLPLAQVVLLVLMYVGGCTGSTAGGIKVARALLLGRVVDREFKRMVEPRGVFAVRLGGSVVPEPAVQSLLNLVYLALLVNGVSVLALAAVDVDIVTAFTAVAACMFNIGPGLGLVGPTENYGHLPQLAKWVLSFCMIAGRLEFYTLLVIFTPAFWRRW
jgi:trk system potassium uptake protein TrkH